MQLSKLFFYVLMGVSFMGCHLFHPSNSVLTPVETAETPSPSINYYTDIKPILDKRCVVCHSCYNAPCQLKLNSYAGIDRGATKKSMYEARLSAADPTRLFIDAQTTEEWRQKEFFPVTDTSASANGSIAMLMLNQKIMHPETKGMYLSESGLTCGKTEKEVQKFFHKNPHKGMPYGFPELNKEEYTLLMNWLRQGAPQGAKNIETTHPEINKWETFLNGKSVKNQVMAHPAGIVLGEQRGLLQPTGM